MGFGDKIKALKGPSKDLLEHGILGRGQVVSVAATGASLGFGGGDQAALQQQVCTFELNVLIDNTPGFQVKVNQKIPAVQISRFQPGVTVAVRVDPADHTRVCMDLATKPPTVTLAPSGGFSLADVLATGTPCHIVVTDFEGAMGLRTPAGLDIYSFWVTVLEQGKPPRSVHVVNAVPESGYPLLYQGSKLPAKYVDDKFAVDWDAAVAEATAEAS